MGILKNSLRHSFLGVPATCTMGRPSSCTSSPNRGVYDRFSAVGGYPARSRPVARQPARQTFTSPTLQPNLQTSSPHTLPAGVQSWTFSSPRRGPADPRRLHGVLCCERDSAGRLGLPGEEPNPGIAPHHTAEHDGTPFTSLTLPLTTISRAVPYRMQVEGKGRGSPMVLSRGWVMVHLC